MRGLRVLRFMKEKAGRAEDRMASATLLSASALLYRPAIRHALKLLNRCIQMLAETRCHRTLTPFEKFCCLRCRAE